jgi:hypothetical protein
MKALCVMAVLLLAAESAVYADLEAVNQPVVRSSREGLQYAKSVPDESLGQKGKTRLFEVGRETDSLICEYNWYAYEIYIGMHTLVRFAPWHRGQKPEDGHLAIGFYRRGKTLKEYSAPDLEKMGSGVSTTTGHYEVFGERIGFRSLKDTYVYEVKGVSGKVFTFDLHTGNIVERATERGG